MSDKRWTDGDVMVWCLTAFPLGAIFGLLYGHFFT